MIFFRADANEKIGSGHIQRCIAIADELYIKKIPFRFIVAKEDSVSFIKERGWDYSILDTDYSDMEKELDKMCSLIEQFHPNSILVDSYFATPSYIEFLKKYARVVLIDDLERNDLNPDLLINYNIFAKKEAYCSKELQETELILGTNYVPLKKEYRNINYNLSFSSNHPILITTGGSDKYNIAGQLLKMIFEEKNSNSLDSYKYVVVSGIYNPHIDELKAMASRFQNIEVLSNVRDMWNLMSGCSAAISAGGSTLYELSSMGVPIFCFSFVENQRRIVEGFETKNKAYYAGNYEIEKENCLKIMLEKLSFYMGQSDKSQVPILTPVTDGYGAERIALILEKI